jgi:hypothetical protein
MISTGKPNPRQEEINAQIKPTYDIHTKIYSGSPQVLCVNTESHPWSWIYVCLGMFDGYKQNQTIL